MEAHQKHLDNSNSDTGCQRTPSSPANSRVGESIRNFQMDKPHKPDNTHKSDNPHAKKNEPARNNGSSLVGETEPVIDEINGPYTEIGYAYDGTIEGLLSAIFCAYARHEHPTDVAPESILQPRLGQYIRIIETDQTLASRVERGIIRTCGAAAFDAVKAASLSDDPDAGTIVYRFVRYAMDACKPRNCRTCPRQGKCTGRCTKPTGRSILNDLTHPEVGPLLKLSRAVYNERHLMTQFIRFQHLENDVWFAKCNPSASVVPLLMDWFSARFNTQPFIIYDENHHLAGVYEGRDWYLVPTDSVDLPLKAREEGYMQQAWRQFYHTVAVESRYNPELRRQFMPKRLWKNLTEMQDPLPNQLMPNSSKSGMKDVKSVTPSCQ